MVPKHPTQIYEGVAYLLIFVLLFWMYWRTKGKVYQGMLIGIFLVLVFTARFFIEFVKENQVPFEESMKLNMGQLLSIPFVLGGLAVLYWCFKNKKPGFISK